MGSGCWSGFEVLVALKDFSWDFAFFSLDFAFLSLGIFWFEIWPEFFFWKLEANDFTAS